MVQESGNFLHDLCASGPFRSCSVLNNVIWNVEMGHFNFSSLLASGLGEKLQWHGDDAQGFRLGLLIPHTTTNPENSTHTQPPAFPCAWTLHTINTQIDH